MSRPLWRGQGTHRLGRPCSCPELDPAIIGTCRQCPRGGGVGRVQRSWRPDQGWGVGRPRRDPRTVRPPSPASVHLCSEDVQEEPVPLHGRGLLAEDPAPPALCQTISVTLRRASGRWVCKGSLAWGGAGRPAHSPLRASPGMLCPGHQQLRPFIRPKAWAKGRTGSPAPAPGPSCLLSLSKKHKTLEIHVLYDGEKKVPNVPPKRQYILYFVKC